MNIKSFIKSRAYRILSNLESFDTSSHGYYRKEKLEEDEEYLGIYHNRLGVAIEAIIVTTSGLHLLADNSVSSIKYADIRAIETPQTKKEETLVITLKNGEIILLPVSSRSGRPGDLFSFLQFLDRVVNPPSGILR